MRKIFILFFIFVSAVFSHSIYATHLVGGQFKLTHTRGIIYTLTMELYFDDINGNPAAEDQQVVARIFSKKDNRSMQTVTLDKISKNPVNYTNPACTIPQLKTSIIIYEKTMSLPPDEYNEIEGYYVVWDRCCRNNIINNIKEPQFTGQLFYLEFPPVIKNGKELINSSPQLFPPVSDYACVNRPFYYDFAGKDPDGDIIVYSITEPLRGFSSKDDPAPLPISGPYPTVVWENGINVTKTIPGNPSLSIDPTDGILKVTPSKTGLFVFAVKCEEYREGIKIGEVRRDFQILVIDCPQPNQPPKITVTPPAGKMMTGKKGDFQFMPGENRCFTFSISDPNPNSKLTAKLRAVNFVNTNQFPTSTWQGTDPLEFNFCFPECPLKNGQPYIIQLIAGDDGCAVPLQDTITLSVKVTDPPPNQVPKISTDLNAKIVNNEFLINTTIGKEITFEVTGTDMDYEQFLNLKAQGKNFSLQDVNALFNTTRGKGSIKSSFKWIPSCESLDLRAQRDFKFIFTVTDEDRCERNASDSLKVIIHVDPLPNKWPILSTSLPTKIINANVGKTISFTVHGTDPDNDLITLTGEGKDFNFQDYGVNFNPVSGKGIANSIFSWTPTCEALSQLEKNEFNLKFTLTDKNCLDPHIDSTIIQIHLDDIPSHETSFLPPNVFTPNNDGIGDVFTLPTLPIDNCTYTFSSITIVNRWGNTIFESEERQFVWDGGNFPPGVYFYRIDYSNNKSYQGMISIIY